MAANLQVLLDHRPTDKVSPANFRVVEAPVPAPGPGEVLVRHQFLSLDPYMRGRLSDAKSYAKPQEVGAVMGGGTVGIVEASNNPRFKAGRRGRRHGRLAALFAERRRGLNVVDAKAIPIQAYLGPVGMPGRHRLVRPQQDHRAESRARRWSFRPRPARSARWSASSPSIAGARAVGIAGGPEKCAYAVRELGYAACVDHKSPRFAEEMKAALPNGVDGLFENVGGEPFAQAMRRLNNFARVAVCGLIASYEGAPTRAARHADLPRQAVQDGRLHRLRSYGPVAAGDRRTGRPSSPPGA